MSDRLDVFQNKTSISVPRGSLKDIACNNTLSKKDLRVFIYLLTCLGGYNQNKSRQSADPQNYTAISPGVIAETIDMKKDDVKDAIETLMREGIIEKGPSSVTKNGYRFTF